MVEESPIGGSLRTNRHETTRTQPRMIMIVAPARPPLYTRSRRTYTPSTTSRLVDENNTLEVAPNIFSRKNRK